MKKLAGLVFTTMIIFVWFAGCNNEPDVNTGNSGGPPPGPPVLNSIAEVKDYLGKQGNNKPENPVELVVKIDLADMDKLYEAIRQSQKYVSLDLKNCYNVPAEYASYASSSMDYVVSITLPAGVTRIANHAFYNWKNLKRVVLPASVTRIGYQAFCNDEKLESINFPASITEIWGSAFNNCKSLKSIDLPANLTSIGDFAFSGCTGLSSIDFPANFVSIGDGMFSRCSALEYVDLPASLTSIGNGAFTNCESLKEVRCRAATPPELVKWIIYEGGYPDGVPTDISLHFPIYVSTDLVIKVPIESESAYKTAWAKYADKIVGVTVF